MCFSLQTAALLVVRAVAPLEVAPAPLGMVAPPLEMAVEILELADVLLETSVYPTCPL